MAWIEVHQELREHKKLYACAELLKISRTEMLGTIIALWLWALDNVPDGSLAGISNRTIARVCDWPERRADTLVNALISTGWLDKSDDAMSIHDWTEYVGKLMERRRKDRDRKKKSVVIPQNSAGVPQEIPRQSEEIPVLQYPNRTVPIPNHNYSAPNPVEDTPPPQEAPAPFDGKSFTAFWDAYPSKIDRNAAWEAWCTIRPDGATAAKIIAALNAWKSSSRWGEDGGRFIPHAAKFLSMGHWQSPPVAVSTSSGERQLDAEEQAAIRRLMEEPI